MLNVDISNKNKEKNNEYEDSIDPIWKKTEYGDNYLTCEPFSAKNAISTWPQFVSPLYFKLFNT